MVLEDDFTKAITEVVGYRAPEILSNLEIKPNEANRITMAELLEAGLTAAEVREVTYSLRNKGQQAVHEDSNVKIRFGC